MTTFDSLPLWKAAYCVLYQSDSLHISRLLEQMESLGWQASGKTPVQTLRSELRRYSESSAAKSVYFQNLGQATWNLTEWGKSNPPLGVKDLLFSGTVQWIESHTEFVENQQMFLKARMSDSISIDDVQRYRTFFYDSQKHDFFPLQCLISRDWILKTSFEEGSFEDRQELLTSLGLVRSQDPILETRFAQWCREWNCEQLLNAEPNGAITFYKESMFTELSTLQLSDIVSRVRLQHPSWSIDESILRRVHLAWETSDNRFLLLSGLTGVGKSNLVWDYAEAILTLHGLSVQKHRLMIPIQTNFRDPSPLFGYVNTFANPPVFVRGLLTDFLLEAHRNPHLPYYLLLDETNLSKMEHYLAPLISTFEVGSPLVFHHQSEPMSGVPNQLSEWPRNIWIAGTMNFEAGAHLPADKILDRAHSIELWDIDADGWFAQRKDLPPVLSVALSELYQLLRPLYCHFGYRTLESMVSYIQTGLVMNIDLHQLLDEAVLSKVYPKIKGDRTLLTADVFDRLEEWCEKYQLPLCLNKTVRLRTQVQNFGMVRYWH